MKRFALLCFLVCSAASLAGGCSSPDPGTGNGFEDTSETLDDAGIDGLDDADSGDAEGSGDDVQPDATGQSGDPCRSDDECEGLVCVDIVVGDEPGICSQFCSDDSNCDDGFDCVLILNSGGDAIQVCLPTDLCIDGDDDNYGEGPGCLGPDCDDTNETSNPTADELCDRVDNDCDGVIDDNTINENDNCATGLQGVCAAGRLVCRAGIEECVADEVPSDEVCDLRDNNCDGAVDEADGGEPLGRECYDGAEGTIGVGVCVAGRQTCVEGGYTGCLRQIIPEDESCDGVDNDCNGTVDDGFETREYWPDVDGDGAGDPDGESVTACATPAGYANNNNDCDDTSELIYGGATEVVGDGVDQNCDGVDSCWVDIDEDGFHAGAQSSSIDLACTGDGLGDGSTRAGDCEDNNDAVNPDATENVGDELDQNCDGRELCFADRDNDGFRTDDTLVSANLSCGNDGEAQNFEPDGDCNDDDRAIRPDAAEVCDGVDNNCDDVIDNGGDGGRFWPDSDNDGFGDADAFPIADCSAPDGFVDNDEDCNDDNELVRPDAAEMVADGIDNNCDGIEVCYVDGDGDGWRPSAGTTVESVDLDCLDLGEANALALVGDCDDTLAARNNGAAEICDRIDNDCDGLVDGADPDFAGTDGTFWPDVDGDTFGDQTAIPLSTCNPPSGWVTNGRDCNDAIFAINPDAVERIDDGVDQNCDAQELCFQDLDNDGYAADGLTRTSIDSDCTDLGEARASAPGGDCNDRSGLIYPGAEEIIGDEIDQDCDGGEVCRLDADGDGWRPDVDSTINSADRFCNGLREATATAGVGDCNDSDALIYPTATELIGDQIDQNCDGVELCLADLDGDNYSSGETIASSDNLLCTDEGEARAGTPTTDCNDVNPAINPAVIEICDGLDNNCNTLVDGADPQIPDADSDGIDACSDCDDDNPAITNVFVVTGGGIGAVIEGDIFGDGITQVTAVVTSALVISDLNAVVNITHGWNSDMAIRLRGPDGTAVTLSNRRGGNGNNYTDTIFDDEATRTIASGTPPFTGSYRPETPLSAFDGKSTTGTWILEIEDYISDQDGTLNGWELRFGLDCR